MRGLFTFLFSCLCAWITCAQSVFLIPPEQVTVDGDQLHVLPGDSILLAGGVRAELRLLQLHGSPDLPVIVAVLSDPVIIDTDAHTGLSIEQCDHIRVTGLSEQDTFGIEIAAAGTMGVYVTDFSTDCEVDHLRVHDVGFAGIMAKTDPVCSEPDLSAFVMRNLSFHHNDIYSTGGEGFYIGYSWYPGRDVDCDGNTVTLYPHAIRGLKIYENTIAHTAWDGLQVGSAPSDVEIYNNIISYYGEADETNQNHAVQIGAGTSGRLYNNRIAHGSGGGVYLLGYGDNHLFNNVIAWTGENAIYQNDKDARRGTNYRIYNNTIISPALTAIQLTATVTTHNVVANNLIVLGTAPNAISGNNYAWEVTNNRIYQSEEEVSFVNADSLDFHLTDRSSAIDAGVDLAYLYYDADWNARPAGVRFDVGAYEWGADPYEIPVLAVKTSVKGTDWKVYPNPVFQGVVHVQLAADGQADQILIRDLSGKILHQIPIRHFQKEITIPAGRYSDGLYVLELLRGDQKVSSRKLIIHAL